MKKKLFLIFISFFITLASNAETSVLNVFKKSYKLDNLNSLLPENCKKLGIDIKEEISDSDLSIINFILKNTYENNIHKMRGEKDNVVYTSKDGKEAVFDKDGNLVTNDWNKGSYNYASYDMPVEKFYMDIFPWLVWGNTRNDPTDFEERFYYYLWDLDYGIQSYIFLEDKSKLDVLKYKDLSNKEKYVYKFFEYLLFNNTYKNKLCNERLNEYKESSESYFSYFNQIFELSGYKK